jgi:integrase
MSQANNDITDPWKYLRECYPELAATHFGSSESQLEQSTGKESKQTSKNTASVEPFITPWAMAKGKSAKSRTRRSLTFMTNEPDPQTYADADDNKVRPVASSLRSENDRKVDTQPNSTSNQTHNEAQSKSQALWIPNFASFAVGNWPEEAKAVYASPASLSANEMKAINWVGGSLAPSTTKTNDSVWNTFKAFCEGRQPPLSYIPALPDTLVAFIQYGSEQRKWKISYIRRAMSVIAVKHVTAGYKNPAEGYPLIKLALRAAARMSTPISRRTPLTPANLTAILAKAKQEMNSESKFERFRVARDAAIIVLGFAAQLRADELAKLQFEHLSIVESKATSPEITVTVAFSKTDRVGQSATVSVPPSVAFMPLKEYVILRGIAPGPLFLSSSASRVAGLSSATIRHIVKKWCAKIGIDVDTEPYGAHSLRRGGQTLLAAHNVQPHVMRKHGRWSPNSNMIQIYTDLASKQVGSVVRNVYDNEFGTDFKEDDDLEDGDEPAAEREEDMGSPDLSA